MSIESALSHPTDIDYERLSLQKHEKWTWILSPNQSYLGRSVFVLRRACNTSLAELGQKEWDELKILVCLQEQSINEIFRPDRYNYTQMGNVWEQLHVHAIPRYRAERVWNGHKFRDLRWGMNPAPTPESPISLETTYQFADWLRGKIHLLPTGLRAIRST